MIRHGLSWGLPIGRLTSGWDSGHRQGVLSHHHAGETGSGRSSGRPLSVRGKTRITLSLVSQSSCQPVPWCFQ